MIATSAAKHRKSLRPPYGAASPNTHAPYPTTRSREPAVSPELHNSSRRAQAAALGFDKQSGHGVAAASLFRTQDTPIAALDRGGGR